MQLLKLLMPLGSIKFETTIALAFIDMFNRKTLMYYIFLVIFCNKAMELFVYF
jgi:hypothetical protein